MTKNIVVFLNNRIGTCDAILPILMDVKRKYQNIEINFVTISADCVSDLAKNEALIDGLRSIGTLTDLSGNDTYWQKCKRYLHILKYAASGYLNRSKLLHFRLLAVQPMRMIHFFSAKNCFHFDGGAFGTSGNLDIVHDWQTKYQGARLETLGDAPFSKGQTKHAKRYGHPVFMGNGWEDGNTSGYPRDKNTEEFIIPPSRGLSVWTEYAESRADQDFAAEFAQAGIEPTDEVIVFMSCGVTDIVTNAIKLLRDQESLYRQFRSTIKVLLEVGGGRPIFIRTQYGHQEQPLLDILKEFPGVPIALTNLHATVLATRAKVFVTNWMSTTMADARVMGVPTVEYADYRDDLLQVTGGRSHWPDWITHFINGDEEMFRTTMVSILSDDGSSWPGPKFETQERYTDLINRLAE
jgi:hypothetical protein